jgi:outer membrane lipoprotein-sorting protein
MIGLRNLSETVIDKWLGLTKVDGTKVSVYPSATIGDLSCKAVEVVLAKPVDGVPQQTARLYVDNATGLPVRVQSLAFPKNGEKPGVIEDYYYSKLKTNVGLADVDFDVTNPAYGY